MLELIPFDVKKKTFRWGRKSWVGKFFKLRRRDAQNRWGWWWWWWWSAWYIQWLIMVIDMNRWWQYLWFCCWFTKSWQRWWHWWYPGAGSRSPGREGTRGKARPAGGAAQAGAWQGGAVEEMWSSSQDRVGQFAQGCDDGDGDSGSRVGDIYAADKEGAQLYIS